MSEFISRRAVNFVDAISQQFTNCRLRLLDVGCGSMPYRSAFTKLGNLEYVGADIPSVGVMPEIVIDPQSECIPAPDASFHGLLHFQVMEHVPDYQRFLSECYRVLKPGGAMFCTVPFAFEFHGVPSDFRRWSSEGLIFDLEKVGFARPEVTPVESGFLSVLSISELYAAARFGYRFTRPIFLAMNIVGFLFKSSSHGLVPLTNGALCQKPW